MQFITLLAQCQFCYITLPSVKMCDKPENMAWCVQKFTIRIMYIQTPRSYSGVKFDPKTIKCEFSEDPLPRLIYTKTYSHFNPNNMAKNGFPLQTTIKNQFAKRAYKHMEIIS